MHDGRIDSAVRLGRPEFPDVVHVVVILELLGIVVLDSAKKRVRDVSRRPPIDRPPWQALRSIRTLGRGRRRQRILLLYARPHQAQDEVAGVADLAPAPLVDVAVPAHPDVLDELERVVEDLPEPVRHRLPGRHAGERPVHQVVGLVLPPGLVGGLAVVERGYVLDELVVNFRAGLESPLRPAVRLVVSVGMGPGVVLLRDC